jgi:hypothetical protein
MSTTAFVPTTIADEFVASGATSNPFTGLTITSNEPPTSTQLIESIESPGFASVPTLTTLGSVSDSTGGGTAVSPLTFLEVNTIGSVTGDTVLKRLQFVAPTLTDGQSIEEKITLLTATSLVAGGPLDSNVASTAFNIDIVTAPLLTGAVANQPDGGASIDPFATMVVTDADFNNTAMDTATITITDPAGTPTDGDGLLTGVGLSKTGIGTYSVPNPVIPGTLTIVLQKLKFTPSMAAAGKTTNFEVDATDTKANLTSKDNGTSVITPGPVTPPPGNDPMVVDTTTGANLTVPNPPTAYPGPVVGPTNQYINVTPDNLNITAKTSNWFLHSGSGEDAIQVTNGINILDGGTGSNFLVDGMGMDTDFVDARSAPSDIWSTVVGFKIGDDATMFGLTPAMFNVAMVDNDGAAGFTGLTFHATKAGSPEASLTLAGFSQADLTSGKLTMGFGAETDGTPFLHIHAT